MKSQGITKEITELRRKSQNVSVLLKQLSHPQRLLILCSLVEGEKSVGEIEAACGASQSAVSQFLKNERYNYELLFLIGAFVVVEWNSRTKVEPISGKYSGLKLVLCLAAILALGTFSDYKEFIYFQF